MKLNYQAIIKNRLITKDYRLRRDANQACRVLLNFTEFIAKVLLLFDFAMNSVKFCLW